MNILHIITGLGIGGAERVVLDLAAKTKIINNVFIVSLSNSNEFAPRFKQEGIEPIVFDLSNPIKFISVVFFVIRLILRNNISIVHVHMFHPVLLTPFIKIFTNAKIVFTSHNFNIGGRTREFLVYLLKPFRDVDVLFSFSQFSFFNKKKYILIPNGVDIERYCLDKEKFQIFSFIAVGRLQTVKNHVALFSCLRNLVFKHGIECQLNIVGDGELRAVLESKIVELGLTPNVKLLGIRNDINILMNQSHCLLMPSLWEGLPIVILEAGASCLPIISTPVGSIPTLLTNDNAYLSEIENFEETMLDVVNNYSEAQKKAGKLYDKIVNSYSLDAIIEQHLSLYNSLNNDLNITE